MAVVAQLGALVEDFAGEATRVVPAGDREVGWAINPLDLGELLAPSRVGWWFFVTTSFAASAFGVLKQLLLSLLFLAQVLEVLFDVGKGVFVERQVDVGTTSDTVEVAFQDAVGVHLDELYISTGSHTRKVDGER